MHHGYGHGDEPGFMLPRPGVQQKQEEGLVELFQARTGVVDDELAGLDAGRGGRMKNKGAADVRWQVKVLVRRLFKVDATQSIKVVANQLFKTLSHQQFVDDGRNQVSLPGAERSHGHIKGGVFKPVAACAPQQVKRNNDDHEPEDAPGRVPETM